MVMITKIIERKGQVNALGAYLHVSRCSLPYTSSSSPCIAFIGITDIREFVYCLFMVYICIQVRGGFICITSLIRNRINVCGMVTALAARGSVGNGDED